MILRKSVFEDFSAPKIFQNRGNLTPPSWSLPHLELYDEHGARRTERSSWDHVKAYFRDRGTHKNTLGMLSFHFVKIDFRKIFDSQKILGSGFCVLPFLGLANTMHWHAETHFECGRRYWIFHENIGFRQHNAWQVHKSTLITLRTHPPTH